MSEPTIDLAALEALEKAVAASDEGEPWDATLLPGEDRWSIGPDYEMGHRAELDGWCESEAHLLVDLRNAAPHLIRVVRAALEMLDAFEDEEEEYGFPFNFALRDAHRELKACVAPFLPDTTEGVD